jgi:hypothetical protein
MVANPDRTARARKPAKPLPAHAYYVQRAILFSVCGRWPMAYATRRAEELRLGYSIRRDWGTYDKPQPPPPGTPDRIAESANKFLRKKGWQLTKGVDGSWTLGRVPNF